MTTTGIDTQTLWMCRWGTVSALVWANGPGNAELRVRHRAFDRTLNERQVRNMPVKVKGDVIVREATPADLEAWQLAGGEVPS